MVAPDTDLAGYPATEYPANNFAGYRISDLAGYQKSFFWQDLTRGNYLKLLI